MRLIRTAIAGAGILAMGYAVVGALSDPDERLPGHLAFLLTVQAAHDAVLLPAALAAGVLIHRHIPPRVRAPLQAALLVSVAVLVVGVPLALGFGRSADDPSALPLDYRRGLLIVLAVIWLVTAAAILIRQPRLPSTAARQDSSPR